MTVLPADHVVAALRGAFAREATRAELLQLAATKIQAAGPPYTSVYLYMVDGEELVLEAYAGRIRRWGRPWYPVRGRAPRTIITRLPHPIVSLHRTNHE